METIRILNGDKIISKYIYVKYINKYNNKIYKINKHNNKSI